MARCWHMLFLSGKHMAAKFRSDISSLETFWRVMTFVWQQKTSGYSALVLSFFMYFYFWSISPLIHKIFFQLSSFLWDTIVSSQSVTHCYSVRSNLQKMGPLQFCLPVFLGIHRNPKQKDFLIPARDFCDNPIYPLLSSWISTWTEPETYFG